jgi:hypothetical protein
MHMTLLAKLMADLKSAKEDGQSLLDRTMILYGSNLGNASTHVTTNLPTLLMGGGFQHGVVAVDGGEIDAPVLQLAHGVCPASGSCGGGLLKSSVTPGGGSPRSRNPAYSRRQRRPTARNCCSNRRTTTRPRFFATASTMAALIPRISP